MKIKGKVALITGAASGIGEAVAQELARRGVKAVLLVDRNRGILVECGSGSRLWFLAVQPEGKKTLNAADFANGLRLAAGGFLPFVDEKN